MRRQNCFLLSGCMVMISGPAWAALPRPVLRYAFEATSTQRDEGIAPSANGSLAGSAVTAYNSPLSFSCRSLDLTAAGSNYVTTGADMDKLDAMPELTATFWINMRAAPASADCILSDAPAGTPPSGQGGWDISIPYGGSPTADNFQLAFSVSRSTGSVVSRTGQGYTISGAGSNWLFVAFTYDAAQSCRCYIGSEAAIPARIGYIGILSRVLPQNSAEFRVGSYTADPNADHTPPAWIDDVRVYNVALSAADLNLVRLSNLYGTATMNVPAFFGLREPAGGGCGSVAQALSADGSTVVGFGAAAVGTRAFRWRYNSMEPLLDPHPDTSFSIAAGVSADGAVVVGHRSISGGGTEAYRWGPGGATTSLGKLPGGDNLSYAYGTSGDGGITVGYSGYQQAGLIRAFQFATAMTPLGLLPGDDSSVAFGISRDGTLIVGSTGSTTRSQACVWRNGVPQGLGGLPGSGTTTGIAWKVSADKQTIVGQVKSGSNQEAALWRSGHVIGLGTVLDGARTYVAYGVSASGSHVVGYLTGTPQRAFIWDRQHGARELAAALTDDYGLDLTGWQLSYAVGVSDDGAIIAGSGTNPSGVSEAWIARLPVPPAIADFNADGHVDGLDVDVFAACATGSGVVYGPGNVPPGCALPLDVLGLLAADFDWDNDVDMDDFAAFQRCVSGPASLPPPECQG